MATLWCVKIWSHCKNVESFFWIIKIKHEIWIIRRENNLKCKPTSQFITRTNFFIILSFHQKLCVISDSQDFGHLSLDSVYCQVIQSNQTNFLFIWNKNTKYKQSLFTEKISFTSMFNKRISPDKAKVTITLTFCLINRQNSSCYFTNIQFLYSCCWTNNYETF